jgi:hypothetical protein
MTLAGEIIDCLLENDVLQRGDELEKGDFPRGPTRGPTPDFGRKFGAKIRG